MTQVDEWFLMSSPVKPTILILAYMLIAVRIGPAFMKNRAPYNLKHTLTVYNIFQMIYNSCLFIVVWNEMQVIRSLMNDDCKIERTDEKLLECLSFGWVYLVNKIVDLLDTIFMILRKKNEQISFLHVYHHSIMIFLSWFGIKYMGEHKHINLQRNPILSSRDQMCNRNKITRNMGYSFNELVALICTSKDSRVHDWFFMSSPVKLMILIVVYILIAVRIGPSLMKNRAPYDLKYTLTVYNIFQMIYNSYLFVVIWNETQAIRSLMNDDCKIKRSDESTLQCFGYGWWYIMNKIVDLLDTMFMVLRKKNHQITFLHVYHHSAMIVISWVAFKYMGVTEEHGVVMWLNAAVHVIMYFYYLVAAMGPQYQKYLWWKRYITKIQIGQFLAAPLYMIASAIKGCQISKAYTLWIIINASIFVLLFVDFYRKAYKKSSGVEHKKDSDKKCEKST
uniref:Elongation of very long chain fatty acids protein n=1 Tax=Glossina morsitans morsitans TaxID=37546 RepID=A0A1B0G677_GLOMM